MSDNKIYMAVIDGLPVISPLYTLSEIQDLMRVNPSVEDYVSIDEMHEALEPKTLPVYIATEKLAPVAK